MKKILLVGVFCLVLFSITGCGNKENQKLENKKDSKTNIKDIYMEVLENKRDFQEYNVIDDTFEDMGIKKVENYYDVLFENKMEYVFIDIDQDKNEELVIRFANGNNIIFKYNEQSKVVNGFVKYDRSFKKLRENGYYEGSGGADSRVIFSCSFIENAMIEKELAQNDYGKYTIDKKSVSEQEYKDYINKNVESKKEVEWLSFEVKQISKNDEKENVKTNEKGFVVGDKIVKYGTYYVQASDGTLLTDGSGTIEIKENGICSYFEGWADMGCKSYYEGKKDGSPAICLKTDSDDLCFTIDKDVIKLNERNSFKYNG